MKIEVTNGVDEVKVAEYELARDITNMVEESVAELKEKISKMTLCKINSVSDENYFKALRMLAYEEKARDILDETFNAMNGKMCDMVNREGGGM